MQSPDPVVEQKVLSRHCWGESELRGGWECPGAPAQRDQRSNKCTFTNQELHCQVPSNCAGLIKVTFQRAVTAFISDLKAHSISFYLQLLFFFFRKTAQDISFEDWSVRAYLKEIKWCDNIALWFWRKLHFNWYLCVVKWKYILKDVEFL